MHGHPAACSCLHAKALAGNPYDGHTLAGVVDELTDWIGARPKRIYVDKGYRGHKLKAPLSVYRSGQKRGVTAQIKRELRRRTASTAITSKAVPTVPTPSSPPPATTSSRSPTG